MSGSNPMVTQGTLNRILTQITLASYPALNVSSGYMTKGFATLSFDDPFVTQIETATGLVNSPEPYVKATLSFGLLRTQSLAGQWLSTVAASAVVGSVTGYPDSVVFPSITLSNCSILSLDPGAWDGTNPVVAVMIKGTYNVNSSLWG